MFRRTLLLAPSSVVFLLLLTACGGSAAPSSTTSTSGGATPSTSSGLPSGSNPGNGGGSSTTAASAIGHLYVLENPNGASVIEGFTIGSTGALTALSTAVSAGDNANDIVADTAGKFVFAGNSPGCCAADRPAQVISYTIGPSGTLTQASTMNPPNASDTLNGLLLDPSGRDLYASSMEVMIKGTISSFAVDRNSGTLSTLAPDPNNTIMPGRMVMHPNGRFVYAAVMLRHHYPDMGGFALFLRDPASGALTQQTTYPGPGVGSDFYTDAAIALGGQYLLGVDPDTQKITAWSIDSGTGTLTIASNTSGSFKGLTVDSSGHYAIATLGDGTVESFKVNADGSLTEASTATAAAGVTAIVTDATGRFVYVENPSGTQIFSFELNSSSGALTSVQGSPFATTAAPIRMASTK